MQQSRIEVLGIPLDPFSRRSALARIGEHLQSFGSGLLAIATLNPEYVMAARRQPSFKQAIAGSDLIVCDGVGALAAAKLLHRREAARLERLTGFDLTVTLARWSAFLDGNGLFLLGGVDAGEAANGLARLTPNVRIAGSWSGGSPEESNDAEALRRIQESGASVLLVAYGAPEQVLWIERNRDQLSTAGVRVAVGIGGVLDYFSGHARQAPEPLRRIGLEWLYRLMQEPRRWRRQLALPMFTWLVAKTWLDGVFHRTLALRGVKPGEHR